MFLAAGIVARVEGHRDNGPATRAAALAQQRAGSSRRAQQQRRTVEDLEQAPPFAQLLEVLEKLRRPGACSRAHLDSPWACGQNLKQNVDTRELARESRNRTARWAWRFERVAVLTLKGGQCRGHSSQSD